MGREKEETAKCEKIAAEHKNCTLVRGEKPESTQIIVRGSNLIP